MSRLPVYFALCVVMLAASLAPHQSTAQDKATSARAVANFEVNSSELVKFPVVSGLGNQVYLIGNPGSSNSQRVARVWQKTDSNAATFASSANLGQARGQQDYATASISANRFTSTIYAAWIDQDTNRILFRSRPASSSTWGSTITAVNTSANPYYVSIGSASDGRLWVAWSQERRIRWSTSGDGGANWSSPRELSSSEPLGRPAVVGGVNGIGAITFGSNDGNIYIGIWDGSGFDVSRVTNKSGDDYFTGSQATIDPRGTIFLAWRNVAGGAYYSERQSNGSWPVSRMTSNEIFESVPIASDEQGNIHIYWSAKISGVAQLFYKFKPANGPLEDTVSLGNPGGFVTNPSAAATVSDKGYGHLSVEWFSGRGLRTRYYLTSANATPACDATITLTGGDVTNSRTINGTITPNTGCTPTQRQISLNSQNVAAPTEAYSSAFQVTVPADQLALCTHTVNVRLIQSGNAGPWISKSIKVDPGDVPNPVSALVSLENPMYDSVKDVAGNGPSDGDPGFTRVAQAKVRIQDAGDCTGLATFSAPGAPNQPITSSNHTQVIGLPAQTQGASGPQPGPVPLTLTVVDKVNNIQNFNTSIIYDPADTPQGAGAGRPVLNSADTPTADDTAAARLTILRTLSFTDVDVSDNYYQAPTVPGLNAKGEFWGVWIATKYIGATDTTPALTNPISDTTLNWFPVEVPQSSRTCDSGGCNFTVPVNLFQGLGYGPDLTKAGYYQVYAYFLDGAGNRSAGFRVATARLDQGYSLPGAFLTPVFFASN